MSKLCSMKRIVIPDFDSCDRCDGRIMPLRFTSKKWEYHQPFIADRLRYMTRSGGYVMVRKPRAMPFVVSEKEWAKFPLWVGS